MWVAVIINLYLTKITECNKIIAVVLTKIWNFEICKSQFHYSHLDINKLLQRNFEPNQQSFKDEVTEYNSKVLISNILIIIPNSNKFKLSLYVVFKSWIYSNFD